MGAAIAGTLLFPTIVDYTWILVAFVIGTVIGVPLSRVPLTAVPQRTALSHAFGGLAVGLVGTAKYILWLHQPGELTRFRVVAIVFEVLLGFLTHHVTHMPAAVPATVGAAAALIVQDRLYLQQHRPSLAERVHGVLTVTERDIEWPTLAFFGFLFIIVGAAVNTGLIGTIATALQDGIALGERGLGLSPQATLLFAAILICWTSGTLSALIDNIPFVAVSIRAGTVFSVSI